MPNAGLLALVALAALLPVAAQAQTSPGQEQQALEQGLAAALSGCEKWVLEPATWASDLAGFPRAAGLEQVMAAVERVEEVNLPPPAMRLANHYYRINSTMRSGYVLVVSDRLPMCHITGGGGADLQPAVEAVLASPEFRAHWEWLQDMPADGLATSRFRNREDQALSIVITRARRPGDRLDRAQLAATAIYDLGR